MKMKSLLIFCVLFTATAIAQNHEIQKPMPEGGIKALYQNVVYPEKAKEAGVQGQVIVEAVIDVRGNVADTKIIKSVSKELDNAAVNAIVKTKFKPGLQNNKPVRAKVVIPISFRLK